MIHLSFFICSLFVNSWARSYGDCLSDEDCAHLSRFHECALVRVSPFYCFQAQGLMSKSKSPQYIFVKLRVPGASQSLFSPFFLSVGVELDFEESGIWSNLPSVAVSDGLPSVHVSVSVLSLTLKNLESGPIFRQWLSVPGCQVSKSQCQY